MTSVAFRSFAGGEVAPALYARTDTHRYQTALRTMRNFIAQRHGGAANRPGTELVREVKTSANVARLIKFIFNAEQSYVLELGDRYVRFHQNGGVLVVSGVAAWVTATAYAAGDLTSQGGVNYVATAAHTSGATTQPGIGADWNTVWYALTGTVLEIPSPYVAADLAKIKVSQTADVLTMVHPSYPPYELRRYSNTKWVLAAIVFGPSIGQVSAIGSSGGSAGASLSWAITAIDESTSEEGLPVAYATTNRIPSATTPTILSWTPVPGAVEYNVYRSADGVTFGLLGPAGGTLQTASDTAWTSASDSVVTTTQGVTVVSGAQARNPIAAITATERAYDGAYRVKGRITLSAVGGTPSFTTGAVRAYYSRNGEARVDAGVLYTRHLFGAGSITNEAFTGVINVPDNGYTTLTIDLVPEVLGTANFGTPTFTMTVDVSAGPNNAIEYTKSTIAFSDVGNAVNYQQAPPSQASIFNAANEYPSAVGVYQQRRLLASTSNEPERVWASRSGAYKNFATSTPLQEDDMVSWVLAGRQVNAVEHMIDLGELMVFTSGTEQRVRGDQAGILRPGEINPVKLSAHGAADMPAPLEVGDSAIYVQARGAVVRDLKPIADAGTYEGTDLTVMASHLFEGYTIADWDYAETPNGTVHAVRSDGVLLGLTYLREHNIWGWHRHDTDGVVENVCVVPEGVEDRVYLVVRRTIGGATKRYIERMARRYFAAIDDAVFLDSSLSYDGRHTGTTTMVLSGGTNWTYDELLTITASIAAFTAGDVGNAIHLTDAGGNLIRFTLLSYTSTTVMQGKAHKTVPATMRGIAVGNGSGSWAKAVASFTGLSHLEGKQVSAIADGYVVASPGNSDYGTPLTVAGGAISLARPYARVRVGLPYVSDLETLDIDTAGGPSLKTKTINIKRVGLILERSRGGFVGRSFPTGTDP